MVATILIGICIAALIAAALISVFKQKKKKGCAGCSGCFHHAEASSGCKGSCCSSTRRGHAAHGE